MLVADHVCAAVTLLGMISCDPRPTSVSLVIELSSVEAMVNAMRAFSESSNSLVALSAAMLNVCQHADGAIAVVSRGGSRQISRMLQDAAMSSGAALVWGSELPSVLEHFLAVIDVASAFEEAAETLKKQGIVHVVVSVLDSAIVGEAGASAAADRFDEVRRLITSILSKLLNMAEVGEATKAVVDTCGRIQAGIAEGAGGGLSRTAVGVGVAGLNKLAALCEVAIGRNAGHELWRAGCKSVLDWAQLVLDALTVGQEQYGPSLGLAAQTIRNIIQNRRYFANGTAADAALWDELGAQCIPVSAGSCVLFAGVSLFALEFGLPAGYLSFGPIEKMFLFSVTSAHAQPTEP